MNRQDIERIWAAADYAPTAARLAPVAEVVATRTLRHAGRTGALVDIGAGHGQLAALLAERTSAAGRDIVAVEPTTAMVGTGRSRTGAAVNWRAATAENTGLDEGAAAGIASCFGWTFGEPDASCAEATRILSPDGCLVVTAWAPQGFLHDMTERMADVLPHLRGSLHLSWGEEETARARLAPYFAQVDTEVCRLDWSFPSVAAGMELYRHGSPTHTVSFAAAGERRGELEEALEAHLRECAGPDGAIRSEATYLLVTATGPRCDRPTS